MTDQESPMNDRHLILLENIQGQMQLLADGQIQLRTGLMSEITSTRETLENRIQIVELAVNRNARAIQVLDGRVQRLDEKFDRVAGRVDQHDSAIKELKAH